MNTTKSCVTKDKYLGKEYRIHFRAMLKMLQNAHSLNLPRLPMNVRFFQFLGVCLLHSLASAILPRHSIYCFPYLECKHIVGKHNDFVPPVLVVLDKELTRLKLSWVHTVKEHTFT